MPLPIYFEMALKQSVSFRLGQQLTMTPALQQAIRMLQLSALDLHQELQEALDTNLMLERVEEDETQELLPGSEPKGDDASEEKSASEPASTENENMPDDLPVDAEWDDIYDSGPISLTGGTGSSGPDEDWLAFQEANRHSAPSLHDHLEWQADVATLNETQAMIMRHLIDAIDERGYLRDWEALQENISEQIECETSDIESTLELLQEFDPPGVAARDIQECLYLQVEQLEESADSRETALSIIQDNQLELIAKRDYKTLAKRCQSTIEDITEAVTLIQSLSPSPGDPFLKHETQYVVPEIFVRKHQGRWIVSLNSDLVPRVRIRPEYLALVRRADKSDEQSAMKNDLQEARYLINSLRSRNETLLEVAQTIVETQRQFLEYGEEAMKPLVLREIADKIGMHESTISRATSNKYMHTPRGIYELKYFFSSSVATTTGGSASATAIQAMIRRMIDGEEESSPLSDSRLASLLLEEGIRVARRTVAKYREGMNIPPSHERRRSQAAS